MDVYKALELMRGYTKDNVPFAVEFISCNTTNRTSGGAKVVNKCLLRTGLNKESRMKSRSLVAYTDLDAGKEGFFYIPLLLKLNNQDLE